MLNMGLIRSCLRYFLSLACLRGAMVKHVKTTFSIIQLIQNLITMQRMYFERVLVFS